MRKPLKEFGVRFCISVTILVALFIFGEGVSYLDLKYTAAVEIPPPPSIYENQPWATRYLREWKETINNLQYQSYVIWRRAPYAGETINVDAAGIRKTTYSSCDAGAYSIWMFGNSSLWGTGVPDWNTIPSLLAKKYSDAGRKVCVKNFGEKGWVSTQELIQLMLSLKQDQQKPDLVIFYDGVTDSYLPYQSSVPDAHFNFLQTKRQFESLGNNGASLEYLKRTNTYRTLMELRSILVGSNAGRDRTHLTPEQLSSMAQSTYQNYVKNIWLADLLAKEYGFHCVFFWQPTLLAGHKPLTKDEMRLRQSEVNDHPGGDAVMQAAYNLFDNYRNDNFFDLADAFDKDPDARFVDFSHLGPVGNQIIADKMFAVLPHGT
ncbi:MAG TPA: SGNH/GDSL hydrolase family protein [Candidatus Acidoferrales bacterium]|nr:SGNH/GDSL hydrolase family protein [Candidatus Acidoferrales bacterium]